jgi:hypothetical protein
MTTWRDLALTTRDALELLIGEKVPRCMPHEPDPCGSDEPHHYVSYTAAVQAVAEHHLEHTHHGDVAGEQFAEKLLQFWRKRIAPCCDRQATR